MKYFIDSAKPGVLLLKATAQALFVNADGKMHRKPDDAGSSDKVYIHMLCVNDTETGSMYNEMNIVQPYH